MSSFGRRYSPDWIGVAELMSDAAEKGADEFMATLGRHFALMVENHYNGSEGCPACAGEVEQCSPWSDTQELMLAWLISKVDL